MNVRVSRHLKEELAWATNKWLWVISNKMLFKTVIPLMKLKNKAVLILNIQLFNQEPAGQLYDTFVFLTFIYELTLYGMFN